MSAGSAPQRTCLGCRRTDAPDRMVRLTVVRDDDQLRAVTDPHRRLGGRGAWLHRSPECLESALKRRALHRAFRAPVILDDQESERLRGLMEGPEPHARIAQSKPKASQKPMETR